MYKIILMILFFVVARGKGNLFAQNKDTHKGMLLFNSAKGPVLLFGSNSINGNSNDSKGAHYMLTRTKAAQSNNWH